MRKSTLKSKNAQQNLFNLSLRVRLTNNSISTSNAVLESRNIDFDNKLQLGIGLEAEYILPFQKNKWGILLEPTYQNFEDTKSTENDNISGGVINAEIKYSSIELPIGLRHYLFLNDQNKLFLNALLVWDFTQKNSIRFSREDGSEIDSFEFSTGSSPALGFGYNYNNKLSLETRYLFNRSIRFNNSIFNGGFSVILGYNFL